ncbi:hypothetical protein HRE53_22830 [Acaryochloris sp. 'Moss Beach']|uniref:hypothetical protein n=1 Tax=Acaryochloris sp. 'Moss Beach' TaxID=2740837 RepID=UPI001F38CA00|nr:hypothetical protein [Acaryochloris sp. 'Moss Beach']UJB69190.1 hypothetical protein HRE53_22830 [Acaryochloris sp. 'Moss Beach']
MEITKEERLELLRKIRQASGVAQYALNARMTDEQLFQASQHLDILELIKSANNYNRRQQGLNTQRINERLTDVENELTEAQTKLQEFLNIDKSEIVRAGRWLKRALSLGGDDRKKVLLEKDLVHKEDYNNTISNMGDSIKTIKNTSESMEQDAERIINELEQKVDELRHHLSQVKDYISMNYGPDKWKVIRDTFNIQ